ncbi:MAG TPA: YidC/Oxa1 family membrane protein insertase [Gaiellaceae bacterium]|nr:YidC/Oxa1 family membrane protein insertase [Gaiellaceae bacterium]
MTVASILDPLENILRHVLVWLGPHGTIGLPWAWSIVALTLIVRIIIVPLAVKQIHSMQNLQRYAPQMKELQQKYKHDKQKLNEELMKFYREHKINPAASCLPILVQIPVFFSLYLVLKHSSRFIGPADNTHWLGLISITEKATAGWGPLLIVVYAGSQLASGYFMSTTMEKTQRILMLLLPIFVVPFIVRFQTGLVLYWVTTNLWTVGQGLITRRLVPKTPVAAPARRSSRTPPREEEPDRVAAKTASAAAAQPQAAARRVRRKKKRARR